MMMTMVVGVMGDRPNKSPCFRRLDWLALAQCWRT